MNSKLFIQFFKFGIIGLSNSLISYIVYLFLVSFGVPYIISNIIAFIIGVLNSFFWNNKYVFKKNYDEKRNVFLTLLKTYISYSFTGVILNNILLVLLIEKCMISKYIAPIIILLITVPLNFIMNKFWAFKTKNKN